MRNTLLAIGGAIALSAFALSACGSSSPPKGGYVCPEPILAAPELLYPISGSTGAPDGNFALVFAYDSSTITYSAPKLTSASGTVQAGAYGSPPSPLPSPMATASSGFTTLFGSQVGTLSAGTAYTVKATFGTGVCATTAQLGTFTTK
jgi:hypothetical protein